MPTNLPKIDKNAVWKYLKANLKIFEKDGWTLMVSQEMVTLSRNGESFICRRVKISKPIPKLLKADLADIFRRAAAQYNRFMKKGPIAMRQIKLTKDPGRIPKP